MARMNCVDSSCGAESFAHVEAVMNFLMASLQQHHVASRAEFDAADARLAQSLDAHNRVNILFIFSFPCIWSPRAFE